MPAVVVTAVAFWLGSFGFIVLPFSPVAAQSSSGWPLGDWLKQETMTGDWGGNRTRLEQAGISVRGGYTTESAYNPIGGQFPAARYTQQFDLGADFDLDRLAGIPGGKVVTTLTDRKGRSLSADALGNNRYAVQEVFGGGPITRLVELHYQQELFDKRLLFDIGWEPLGMYFAMSPLWCNFFQTLATCGTVSINSNGHWQDWPFGQWGARVKFQPSSEYYVSTGAYQVNPANATQGFDLSFAGTGVIVPFEFGWLPGQGGRGLPGEYKLGGYFDSSPTSDVLLDVNGLSAGLTGGPFAQHNGRWGLYAQASQMVYREAPGSKRGLTLFGMATLSDPKTATLRYSLTGGAVYQGTFPTRDADFVSLVFAYGRYNSRLTQFQEDLNIVTPGVVGIQTFESVVEVDYGIAVTPWLQVRPNLQYIIRPGGTGRIQDAFVIGLFTRMTF
jgi:porin